MNLNEKLKNYLTHEENDFLKVENSYNKKTSYLVGFEFASGSIEYFIPKLFSVFTIFHFFYFFHTYYFNLEVFKF